MSSATLSSSSVGNVRGYMCRCGLQCVLYTSSKPMSYGRRFYRCPRNMTPADCKFFLWTDQDSMMTVDGDIPRDDDQVAAGIQRLVIIGKIFLIFFTIAVGKFLFM